MKHNTCTHASTPAARKACRDARTVAPVQKSTCRECGGQYVPAKMVSEDLCKRCFKFAIG